MEQSRLGPCASREADVDDLEVRTLYLACFHVGDSPGWPLAMLRTGLVTRPMWLAGTWLRELYAHAINRATTLTAILCSSMLAIGLSWRQALPAIAVGHIIIAVVMVRLSISSCQCTYSHPHLGPEWNYRSSPSCAISRAQSFLLRLLVFLLFCCLPRYSGHVLVRRTDIYGRCASLSFSCVAGRRC